MGEFDENAYHVIILNVLLMLSLAESSSNILCWYFSSVQNHHLIALVPKCAFVITMFDCK